jgi:hypothetical protein
MVSALKLLGMVSHAPSAGSPAAHLFLTRFSRIEKSFLDDAAAPV